MKRPSTCPLCRVAGLHVSLPLLFGLCALAFCLVQGLGWGGRSAAHPLETLAKNVRGNNGPPLSPPTFHFKHGLLCIGPKERASRHVPPTYLVLLLLAAPPRENDTFFLPYHLPLFPPIPTWFRGPTHVAMGRARRSPFAVAFPRPMRTSCLAFHTPTSPLRPLPGEGAFVVGFLWPLSLPPFSLASSSHHMFTTQQKTEYP